MTKDIIKYDLKLESPQAFIIVDFAELYKKVKDILTTAHRTSFYRIFWFQKGSPTHFVDFNPVKIKPNTMLFLNKDTVLRFDDKTKYDGKAIFFTDSFFCKTETDSQFLRHSILFNNLFLVSQIQIKQPKLFTDLLLQMTDELQHAKDNSQADILRNLLHNFLLYSEREKREQNFTEIKRGADLDYVMVFKDLLEAEYKKQKQVNYYAKELIITEKRLNQATAKILGKTPKEMIDDRILLEAKRILAHTTGSVKEIGYELGFNEPTNFIKYFKKHARLTPIEFREKFSSD